MRHLRVITTACTALLALLTSSEAGAQGYGVYEQGTCVMARAGTGVAAPCLDGSSIFFNPAGIATATTRQLSAGATLIGVSGGFTNDLTGTSTDLEPGWHPVPHAYFVSAVSERAAAGIGVFVPYGLTSEWPEAFEGRFLGYKSRIQAIYIQPTAAYEVAPWLRVGAGFDFSLYTVELRQRLDLSDQDTPTPGVTFAMLGIPDNTDFADVALEASSTGIGGHFGIQADVTATLSVGARYLLRQSVDFDDGTAEITQVSTGITLADGNPFGVPGGTPLDAVLAPQFTGSGPLQTQGGSTSVTVPAQLVLGLAWRPIGRARLLFDWQYTDWRVFDTLSIELENLGTTGLPEDFQRAYGYRLGAEYDITPETMLRAGFYTHNGAAPPQTVTPNLPEGGRTSFTVGLGHRFASGLGIDAAYQRISQPDRRGRTRELDPDLAPTENTNGLYSFSAHLFGATLSYTF